MDARRTAAAAAVLLFSVTACGGGSEASTEPGTAAGSGTPTPSATGSAEPTAAAEEYASIVAGHRDDRDGLEEMEDCNWSIPSLSIDRPGSIVCQEGVPKTHNAAMAVKLELADAQNPSAKNYLGAPPAEIASLVDETIRTAETLAQAARSFPVRCRDSGTGACDTKRWDMEKAISEMLHDYYAWDPYI